jgi:CDP-paratose 2-epimerase
VFVNPAIRLEYLRMGFSRIAITGGAGFVGSSLALAFRQSGVQEVCAVDSLKRRGSELNLARLQDAGIGFVHADVRCSEDLDGLPEFDLLIDCSAEPSVHAGMSGSPLYLLNTNLLGTIHCLEAARKRGAALLFLSSSRVYPIAALNALPWNEGATRFHWTTAPGIQGFSERGIAEDFAIDGARSFYGTSKLAGEMLVQEYVHAYGLRALINRCGLLSGPWQLGRVDQGVIALWVARHQYGRPLRYIGYGGTGKQVRDVLHVADLFDLVVRQLARPELWVGGVYNVGGGPEVSVSLHELTELCRRITGRAVPITPVPGTHNVDLRIYLSDTSRVSKQFGWHPKRSVEQVVEEIHAWLLTAGSQLERVFT